MDASEPAGEKGDATIGERKGMASIKPEYLKKFADRTPKADEEPPSKKVKLNSESNESTVAETVQEKLTDNRDRNERGARRKGQNKNRAKFSAQRADKKDRLCSAILHDVECTYGDRCKFSHDLENFMKTKPADIGTECIHFKLKGFCNFSFACRFAGNHVKTVDGVLKNLKSTDPKFTSGQQYTAELNKLDKEVLFKLRKRKYDFSKASKIQKAALKVVAEHVMTNIKKYSTKLSSSDLREELIIMRAEEEAVTEKTAGPENSEPTSGVDLNREQVSSENVLAESNTVDRASTAESTINSSSQQTVSSLETNQTGGDLSQQTQNSGAEGVNPAPNVNGTASCDNSNEQLTSTEHNCGKTNSTDTMTEETTLHTDNPTSTGTDDEKTIPTVTAKEDSNTNVNEKKAPAGCVTDEDIVRLRSSEKKTIDFRNKLYLAPLTTVGNLPFRRVCKEFGAEITCGEMALATKILQGTATEWALLKRHESEDIFGAQICGAYSDSMANCTQLLNETCSLDFIDINVGCPIDMIYDMGAGSALMRRTNRFQEIVRSMVDVSSIPITAKIRTGISASKNTAHHLIPKLKDWGISLITLHGRSREQRYTRMADWQYIDECAKLSSPVPFYGGGDILSFEDYNAAINTSVDGTMIARGALIKPWLFTEIKEQRHWDISSNERLEILRKFSNYGLEHWGSDCQGVETTRRFLLEWLSFLHRYIPVGLLERVPNKINERPPPYYGRNDLETLMSSSNSADWVKISEMLLGKIPDGFFFVPKHKANSYDDQSQRTT